MSSPEDMVVVPYDYQKYTAHSKARIAPVYKVGIVIREW